MSAIINFTFQMFLALQNNLVRRLQMVLDKDTQVILTTENTL